MSKKIELEYNPNITIERVYQVLKNHFPECDQSFEGSFTRLKKSFFVHAIVSVKHAPKKQKTIIRIKGGMSFLAFYLFGFILHYMFRGRFLDEVKDALEPELLLNPTTISDNSPIPTPEGGNAGCGCLYLYFVLALCILGAFIMLALSTL